MQREIEFRGLRKDINQWAYGYFFKHPDGTNSIFIPGEGSFVVDPETVGQYAGLKDRNGNKIFEGDIVKQLGGHKPSVVEFFNSAWRLHRLYILGTEIKSSILEIVGNIHTNKELITQ